MKNISKWLLAFLVAQWIVFPVIAATGPFTAYQTLTAQALNNALAAPNITGGTIDNTVIGGNGPVSIYATLGNFGTLNASNVSVTGTLSYANIAASSVSATTLSISGSAVVPAATLATQAVQLGQLKTLVPVMRTILSGSGTFGVDYNFQTASCNATVGATYTNNGNTYTVYATVASSNYVIMGGGAGAPTASGTLTKASGTGDATIAFTAANAPIAIKVRMVGGGAGSWGGGTAQGTTPTAGGNTTFGTSLLTCNGGTIAVAFNSGFGGVGGTSSISAGAVGLSLTGATGSGTSWGSTGTPQLLSASGASSPFGGAGNGASGGSAGGSGMSNTGSSGGGGGGGVSTGANTGAVGGAGGYIDALITAVTATFSFSIGAGGVAGSAGTSGGNGGTGGNGVIILEEIYV